MGATDGELIIKKKHNLLACLVKGLLVSPKYIGKFCEWCGIGLLGCGLALCLAGVLMDAYLLICNQELLYNLGVAADSTNGLYGTPLFQTLTVLFLFGAVVWGIIIAILLVILGIGIYDQIPYGWYYLLT